MSGGAHPARVVEMRDALGNVMFIAVCPRCYNGSPWRDRDDAVTEARNHVNDPGANLKTPTAHNAPERGSGPNLGEWDVRHPVHDPWGWLKS